MTPPRATYRLQLNKDFTFAAATAIVDYLAALGISHLYVSPFLKARPGSMHGYDIIDHGALNPEIGSEADFAAFVEKLASRGMGLILDIVPNHMGVGGTDNGWWLDVLEWGEASPFARYFDIDWQARRSDLRGKVLLPVLGDHYGVILEKGEIALRFAAEEGSFSAWYFTHRFPISPHHYATILRRAEAEGKDGAALKALTDAFARLSAGRSRRSRETLHAEGGHLKAELAELAARSPAAAAVLDAAAASLMGTPGHAASWRPLDALLDRQAYRLAYWRAAADEINYRRFFNINELAGIRIEEPALFTAAHRLVLALVAVHRLQGLRIDHIDGLFDPRRYCERLQHEASAAAGVPDGGFYLLVEKILAAHERLPDWPVAGTTGYDFINEVMGLFINADNEGVLTRIYRRFTGRGEDFDAVLDDSKRRITDVVLASEMNVLARAFHALSMSQWRSRDFTLNGMRRALEEIIARFPVYRTYVSEAGAAPEDRRYIDWAVAQAKKHWSGTDRSIFDYIHGVLTGDLAARGTGFNRAAVLRLAMKFQQLTGPVMAKGAEDTAFYRYARLIALNEVGGDPRRFGLSVAAFHHSCEARAKRFPQAMLASTTHDTKRGEDSRARLALLSEIPREWETHLARWARFNRRRRGEIDGEPALDRNDEYFFYQTVVGAWPPELSAAAVDAVAQFSERVAATMIKMLREAKERSSWSNPNLDYEAVVARFVAGALDAARPNPFLGDLELFLARLSRPSAVNSLAQTLIKLTVPGVPDTYQGAELWDFSMVDPDNRRPVDWLQRAASLAALEPLAGDAPVSPAGFTALAAQGRDGREKLFLIRRVLALRAAEPTLFTAGAYLPLATQGRFADRLCAFARLAKGRAAVTVVPRLVADLCRDGQAIDWGDTTVILPSGLSGLTPSADNSWRDALAGRFLDLPDNTAPAATLLAHFPVALLVSE